MDDTWIDHLDTIGAEAADKLAQLINEYPYATTYKMLYLVALANTHSTRLNDEIKHYAPALPDRLQLFRLINKGEYDWVSLMKQIEEQRASEPDEANDFELIDQYLDNIVLGTAPEVEYSLGNMPDRQTSRDAQDDLIDKFIEADAAGQLFVPAADAPADDYPTDLENIKERAFLTESLAKLYVKQHKYSQALTIFTELNLKYPKSNSYFADRIRYLQKVIDLTGSAVTKQK